MAKIGSARQGKGVVYVSDQGGNHLFSQSHTDGPGDGLVSHTENEVYIRSGGTVWRYAADGSRNSRRAPVDLARVPKSPAERQAEEAAADKAKTDAARAAEIKAKADAQAAVDAREKAAADAEAKAKADADAQVKAKADAAAAAKAAADAAIANAKAAPKTT